MQMPMRTVSSGLSPEMKSATNVKVCVIACRRETADEKICDTCHEERSFQGYCQKALI